MKNGVPFDVALSFSPRERLAWVVYFGRLEGGEWDFDRMEWVERK